HTTEQLVEGRDELSRILDGVRQLPDDRREALIMRFALGMDNREIARALGRSDGAAKVLIHRAIKQLEEIVGEDRAQVAAPDASLADAELARDGCEPAAVRRSRRAHAGARSRPAAPSSSAPPSAQSATSPSTRAGCSSGADASGAFRATSRLGCHQRWPPATDTPRARRLSLARP